MPKQRIVKKGDTLSQIAAEEGVSVSDISGYKSGNPDLIFPNETLIIDKGNYDMGQMGETTDERGFDLKESGVGDFDLSSEEDKALNQLIAENRKKATSNVDESDIRQRNLLLFQDQIDAVNQIYDSLIAEERIEGADRLGQGRAIRNRQGLVGSARGEKQRQDIVARNSDIMRSIQAERAAKIGSILGEARASAAAEIAAEREAKRASAEDYLDYLSVQDERREKNMKDALASLLQQGYTLDDLSADEVSELSKTLRVPQSKLRATYETMLPDEEEAEQFTLGRYDIRYDSEGNVIARGAAAGGGGTSGGRSSGGTRPTGTPTGTQPVEILSFEEFKETPEAKEILDDAQNAARQTFIPERRDEVLRQAYDELVGELESSVGTSVSSTPPLQNLTTSKKSTLEQGGLLSASGNTQTYFLNTPSKFQSYYARRVASGEIPPNASFDVVDKEYSQWYEQEEGGSSSSSGSSSGSSSDDPLDY